jgi:predicted ATPase/DNA-binding SARP family transcriptional activator/Tfp pilus assembly protein PilF
MNGHARDPQSAIRARLFGKVHIAIGETPLPDDVWSRKHARMLLLLLLSAPEHWLPRDAIIEALWPTSSPDSAVKSFYVAVHSLRRSLEPALRSGRESSYIDISDEIVRLVPGSVATVDVEEFERALQAIDGDRRQHLATALALYAGDFLADEPYLDWPAARREQLRWQWREAVLEYARLEREADQPLLAIPAIERVLSSDPTDEAAYYALMSALAAAGRREEALRQFDRCATVLHVELGARPGEETCALAEYIRAMPITRSTPQTERPRIGSLPAPPNPMIGRGRDVEELLDLLCNADVRLVTITGPGGVGKTRLALEAASLAADEFVDGTGFVSLAPVRDPALVLPVIAQSLGLELSSDDSPLNVMQSALQDRKMLLVLDNFEQILEEAPIVAELLAGCPELTVLATSREPLHLRPEHEFPLLPLPVPDPARAMTAAGLSRYAAAELFVQRAIAVKRDFALTDRNAPDIGLLCARLDGLPLAIELAAARIRHLDPDQLVAGLTHRFELLADGYRDLPPRQRTMRTAISWSYDLLAPAEQGLFRHLSIFTGGFTIDAAIRLAGDRSNQHDVSALVAALADKGLLRIEGDADAPRFDMLETIRQFGLDMLAASGELSEIERAHTEWFVELAERAQPELTGPDQGAWFDRLNIEQANFRAALERAVRDPDDQLALRLTASLWRFWWSVGSAREGRGWVEQALAIQHPSPPALRARALYAGGELSEALGDYDRANSWYEEALHLRQEAEDDAGAAEVLNGMGLIARNRGELDRAEELHERALSILQRTEQRRAIASTLNNLGAVAYFRGDIEQTASCWNQALDVVRAIEDDRALIGLLGNLGALALMQNDPQRAISLHEEGLGIARRIGDVNGITQGLVNLAGALYEHGEVANAAPIYEEALERCRETANVGSEAIVLYDLGKIAENNGDLPAALGRFAESLTLFWNARNLPGAAACLERIGIVFGDVPNQAVRLLAAAVAIREKTGAARDTVDHGEFERELEALRTGLGETAFSRAWSAGSLLSAEDAVAEALAIAERGPRDPFLPEPRTHSTN